MDCHYHTICNTSLPQPLCVKGPVVGFVPPENNRAGWFLMCSENGPDVKCKYERDLFFDAEGKIDSHNFRLRPGLKAPRCDTNGATDIVGWTIAGSRGVCISGFTDPLPYENDNIVSVAWNSANNDVLSGGFHLDNPDAKVRLVFKYAGASLEEQCGRTVAETLVVSATGVDDTHSVYAPASQTNYKRAVWDFSPQNANVKIMFKTQSHGGVDVKCGPFIHDARAYIPTA
jgi:hypothetical protein